MLVGQPELARCSTRPELRQLRQRIVLRHHLRPFDEAETASYVEERLRLAGYTGKGLFDTRRCAELFDVTGGVPRLVNVVCDGALLLGLFARATHGRRDADPRGGARSRAARRVTDAGVEPARGGRPGARRRVGAALLGLFR